MGVIFAVGIPSFIFGVGIGIVFARFLLKRNLKNHGINLR